MSLVWLLFCFIYFLWFFYFLWYVFIPRVIFLFFVIFNFLLFFHFLCYSVIFIFLALQRYYFISCVITLFFSCVITLFSYFLCYNGILMVIYCFYLINQPLCPSFSFCVLYFSVFSSFSTSVDCRFHWALLSLGCFSHLYLLYSSTNPG